MDRFDICVIGGGPAGMMAACAAAARGAKVLLLEKNEHLGKKLELTGRGRCNLAHAADTPEELAERYGTGAAFMTEALKDFGVKDTLGFFTSRGLDVVLERGNRYFPADGNNADSVTAVLKREMRLRRVLVLTKTEVRGLDLMGGKVRRVITPKGELEADCFIVATGGLSFPQTGSNGDGYRFAKKAGCEITDTLPALCPIRVKDVLPTELAALKLKNVRLTALCRDQILGERFGELDFTPFGLSGAIAMDLASTVGRGLEKGPVTLSIDLKPALDEEKLGARLEREFEAAGDLPARFMLAKLLPRDLIGLILMRLRLSGDEPASSLQEQQKEALAKVLKNLSFTVTELMGYRHAIVTAGGVSLDDLSPHTLGCSGVPNLYFAGEVLDLDGPSGGFNLQICWTTGAIAGRAAAAALGKKVELPLSDKDRKKPGRVIDRRAEEKNPRGRAPFGGRTPRAIRRTADFHRRPARSEGGKNSVR